MFDYETWPLRFAISNITMKSDPNMLTEKCLTLEFSFENLKIVGILSEIPSICELWGDCMNKQMLKCKIRLMLGPYSLSSFIIKKDLMTYVTLIETDILG